MTSSSSQPIASKRPRILFVTANLPVPVRGGSSQRTHLLIEALRDFADVELVPVGPSGVRQLLEENGYDVAAVIPPEPSGVLWRIGRLLLPRVLRYRPRNEAVRCLENLWETGRYSIAIGRYLGPSARAGIHCLPASIVDIDDLESQKLASWAAGHKMARWLAIPASFLSARMLVAEQKVTARLLSAWVSAPEDAAMLPSVAVDVVPNIPFFDSQEPGLSPETGKILFVASLDYRVNVNALIRFIEEVWPIVRARHPTVVLRVVGGGLDEILRSQLGLVPGIEMAGFVDDLAAEYEQAMFSVVPIWEGGGTKIKILESLLFGRTCVIAGPSLRGYGRYLQDGVAVLVAEGERDFADAMTKLINDLPVRHRMEQEGRKAVSARFSRRMLTERLRESVETAMAKHHEA